MTRNWGILLLLIAAGQFGSGMRAEAGPAFMQTTGRTTQPIGHYDFCKREKAECNQKSADPTLIRLTAGTWSKIVEINNVINVTIEPRTDMEIWGREEVWSYPVDGAGDCEDYVLEKRRRLMKLGFSPSSLLITVVRQPNGDGHAVLTVRTNAGEFILDNLENRVLAWNQTDYTFLKRQSERNSGQWIAINDGRTDAVASVR